MGEGGGFFPEVRYEVHPKHSQTEAKQNEIVSGQGGGVSRDPVTRLVRIKSHKHKTDSTQEEAPKKNI